MIDYRSKLIIGYTALLSVVGVVCFCILYHSNWIFCGTLAGDDYQFLMTTAIGKMSHGSTWRARFWPLGLSDYSVLLLLPYGKTPLAHYIYNSVILVISSLLFFNFINNIIRFNIKISLFSLFLLFCSSGFMQIHMECIYAERMIFFLLCVFIIFYKKACETKKDFYYYIAFFVAVWATYMKELVFVIFLIIAMTELFFQSLTKQRKLFNYALLFNSFVFIIIYIYRRIFRVHEPAYATIHYNISLEQFFNEPILYFMVILTGIRIYAVFFKKEYKCIFTDALLFAGMGYALSYCLLKLTSGYYLFPSIVLFLPAFAIFINKSNNFVKLMIFLGAIFCAIPNLKKSVHIVINNWSHRQTDELFFQYIVDEFHRGKQIYWLSNSDLQKNNPEYEHLDAIMCLNRFQHFINYYSKFQIQIKRVFNTINLNQNSIVICGYPTVHSIKFNQIKKQLEKIGLYPIKELGGNMLFTTNSLSIKAL